MPSNGQTITIGTGASIAAGDYLVVCNHPQLIRSFQDWAYQDNGNNTTTLYWFPGGTNGANLKNGLTNYAEGGIYANGVSNVTISGLEVLGARQTGIEITGGSSSVTVQSCLVHDNGFGDSTGGPGIAARNTTNTTVLDCEIYSNYTGVTSTNDSGFVLGQSEVAFNAADGIDISGYGGTEASPTIANCYIHNHTTLMHRTICSFTMA